MRDSCDWEQEMLSIGSNATDKLDKASMLGSGFSASEHAILTRFRVGSIRKSLSCHLFEAPRCRQRLLCTDELALVLTVIIRQIRLRLNHAQSIILDFACN